MEDNLTYAMTTCIPLIQQIIKADAMSFSIFNRFSVHTMVADSQRSRSLKWSYKCAEHVGSDVMWSVQLISMNRTVGDNSLKQTVYDLDDIYQL